jgi:hypothetical protein
MYQVDTLQFICDFLSNLSSLPQTLKECISETEITQVLGLLILTPFPGFITYFSFGLYGSPYAVCSSLTSVWTHTFVKPSDFYEHKTGSTKLEVGLREW